jgi:hypothetical protein
MKLRLTQGGFENYTGQMGVVWFENGLSTTDVAPIDGIRISAAIGASWEDGTAANVGEMYLNHMDVPAFVGMADAAPQEQAPTQQSSAPDAPAAAPTTVYSEEELAKIADEKGIAGLRAIGDPLGAKGTAIVGLIAEILKKQGAKPQAAE